MLVSWTMSEELMPAVHALSRVVRHDLLRCTQKAGSGEQGTRGASADKSKKAKSDSVFFTCAYNGYWKGAYNGLEGVLWRSDHSAA
jgi:hypothetical protein